MSKSKKKKKCKSKKKTTKKRIDRVASAREWIGKYEGKNIVRGYSKKYKVDLLCAVADLEIMGHKVDSTYKKQLEQSKINLQKQREEKKRQKEEKKRQKEEQLDIDSDDTYAYIVGYTSGGVPYGVTWEEMDSESEELEDEDYNLKSEECFCDGIRIPMIAYWDDMDDEDDIPF